jgi:hypothetical protein
MFLSLGKIANILPFSQRTESFSRYFQTPYINLIMIYFPANNTLSDNFKSLIIKSSAPTSYYMH